MNNTDGIQLDRIVFIGRTYFEYIRMFGLDESLLRQGRILDCAAGPSSFTAEACKKGINAAACDILYSTAVDSLLKKGREDIEHTFEKVDGVPHLYLWKYYKNREEIVALRQKALRLFAHDYFSASGKDRYVQAGLPHLPFPEGAFSLVLSSHLLFLYGDRLDLDFHIASLREMTRVSSGEVRIYPLLGLDARPYPHMDEMLAGLEAADIAAEIVEIPFEFQRGANRMMKLKHENRRKVYR